jgi:hypothetical protein
MASGRRRSAIAGRSSSTVPGPRVPRLREDDSADSPRRSSNIVRSPRVNRIFGGTVFIHGLDPVAGYRIHAAPVKTGGACRAGGWLVGLLVFPALVSAAQWWRGPASSGAMRATGPLGHAVNLAVFLALYLTWWYAPAVDVLSDAALLFYGSSMLVAAARGYAGCEAFAVSNWLLRRDDRVGCALFGAIDVGEARRASSRAPALGVGHGQ